MPPNGCRDGRSGLLARAAAHRAVGPPTRGVKSTASDGWPAQYGNAVQQQFRRRRRRRGAAADWVRSVKGELSAQVALGSASYLAANAQTESGCSLMVWEVDNEGRQRWCSRLRAGRRRRQSPSSTGSTTSTSASPAPCCRFPRRSGSGGASRSSDGPLTPAHRRARPTAGDHPPGPGAGVRHPSRHRSPARH